MAIRLSGFADEAADSLEEQIAITRELGWSTIELRSIDGANIVDLDDERFERARLLLAESGVRTNALGSTIANWGRSLDEPVSAATDAVERAIPRLHALATRQIRIMSWRVLRDESGRALPDQRDGERIERLNAICNRFAREGITPVHENCDTWGGMSYEHTLRLVAAVPDIRLVFDTGNPPLTPDHSRSFPYPMQSTRDFWDHVKKHVAHIHVKDSRRDPSGAEHYTWPGEGDGDVAYVLRDLDSINYDGSVTIEPHMEVVFHDASVTSTAAARRSTYIEYARRLERMLEDLAIPYLR